MRRAARSRLLAAVVAATVLIARPAASDSERLFPLDEVITRIKWEIQAARANDPGAPRLELTRVDLELRTETVVDADGGIRLGVPLLSAGLSAGGQRTRRQTVELTLVPKGSIPISDIPELGLAHAVREVKRALRAALRSEPEFDLETFTYETFFSLERSAEGEVRVKIVEGGLEGSHAELHRIAFTLEKD